MIFDLNHSRQYETNNCRLEYLSQKSHHLYEILRDSLEFTRKMGLPTIGNPVLKLKSEVLTLMYSMMQHQINCELYGELLIGDATDATDAALWPQLGSLFEITSVLSVSYYDFLLEWELIKDQQERRIISLNEIKISVPA